MTCQPLRRRASTRWLAMNPPAPVTQHVSVGAPTRCSSVVIVPAWSPPARIARRHRPCLSPGSREPHDHGVHDGDFAQERRPAPVCPRRAGRRRGTRPHRRTPRGRFRGRAARRGSRRSASPQPTRCGRRVAAAHRRRNTPKTPSRRARTGTPVLPPWAPRRRRMGPRSCCAPGRGGAERSPDDRWACTSAFEDRYERWARHLSGTCQRVLQKAHGTRQRGLQAPREAPGA